MNNIYPLDHTADDLRKKAAELSQRILAYDPKTGNAENLIKDSVLFNVTYIELQNRATARATKLMVYLAWASAVVAAASLAVAWLSYQATRSGDQWQSKQLELLKVISERIVPASPSPQIPAPSLPAPKSAEKPPTK